MNVSDQIIQILDNLCKKFGLVIDWTSENIVPYASALCTKLVAYEIWTSITWIIIAVIVGVVCLVISTKPSARDRIKDGVFDGGLAWTFITVSSVLAVGCIISNTMDIIKCVTFPEMYIFEYIQRVLSNGG